MDELAGQNVQDKATETSANFSMIDFSRPPNSRERVLFQRRRRRLVEMSGSVRQATENLCSLVARKDFDTVCIRYEFVIRPSPAPGDASDRRLPPREHRPPSTRLMSPRGAALRLMLIALFEAQSRSRAGQRPDNERPLQAAGNAIGWTDLLATDAKPSGAGRSYMSVAAKKGRHLRAALDRLAEEELVALPHGDDKVNRHRNFLLQHEGGRRTAGPNDRYVIPHRTDKQHFDVPVALFTNGWIHVLEDTELAFLLMLAYYQYGQPDAEYRISSEVRLLHLGIGRDAYEAHALFNQLGIASVTEDPNRYPDGKVENYGKGNFAIPHALRFLPDGLRQDGLTALLGHIDYQLSR